MMMIMKNKDEALTKQCEEWLTDEISDGYNSQTECPDKADDSALTTTSC